MPSSEVVPVCKRTLALTFHQDFKFIQMFDYGVKLDIVRDFIFFETNAPMFSGHFGNYIYSNAWLELLPKTSIKIKFVVT